MAVAVETIVKQLTDSGIIAPGKLKSFIPPNAAPKDGEELLRELYKQHLLTKFQAHQVAAGRIKALILGSYTILDKIGAGGMGQVFKAQHRRMDRVVAIKMIANAMIKDAEVAARFEREVRAAAKLEHPNIVTAYDADQANGTYFLVMQYVAGKDLAAVVKEDGPLPVAKAIDCILQAARGLEYAHNHGVIHRDIKPANLLLGTDGMVKVLDMGLARIELTGDDAPQADLTGTGTIMGTVDYMAPEQALNTKHADGRSDIYSLGCTLHYLLTGRQPYIGDTVMEKLIAHREQKLPSLPDAVDKSVQSVFKKMIAKAPQDRHPTMSSLVAALEACRESLGEGDSRGPARAIALPDDAPAESHDAFRDFNTSARAKGKQAAAGSGSQPGRKRRVLAIAGAAGFVLLLLGISVVLWSPRGNEVASVDATQAGPADAGSTAETTATPPNAEPGGTEAKTLPAGGDAPSVPPSTSAPPAIDGGPSSSPPTRERMETPPPGPATAPSESGPAAPAAQSPAPPTQPAPPEPQSSGSQAPQQTPPGPDAAELELLGQFKAEEARFGDLMKPSEGRAKAWNFVGAAQLLTQIDDPNKEFAPRLAARRDELRRMHVFKQAIIAKINAAKPFLTKKELFLRGINGDVAEANESAIVARLPNGKTEQHAWLDLSDNCRKKLFALAADPTSADDWLVLGILALDRGTTALAKGHFAKAESLGAQTQRWAERMARADMSDVFSLIDQNEFAKTQSQLDDLLTTGADVPWVQSHLALTTAVRKLALAGIYEAEADKLYAEAARCFREKEFFELRSIVSALRTNYAGARALTTVREPPLAELEQATEKLGAYFSVRRTGTADFRSIQDALDAAPAGSTIEILDTGPYNEKITISKDKTTLRGKKGIWPIITSDGPKRDFPVLLTFEKNCTVAGLVLTHPRPDGKGQSIIAGLNEAKIRIESSILSSSNYHNSPPNIALLDIENSLICVRFYLGGALTMKNSVWLGQADCVNTTEMRMTNTLINSIHATKDRIGSLTGCTVISDAMLANASVPVTECIINSLLVGGRGAVIENCNIGKYLDEAKPGKDCFTANPLFVNPGSFDFHLQPGSLCRKKATDGGDIGFRYTPEIAQIMKLALDLRSKSVIKIDMPK